MYSIYVYDAMARENQRITDERFNHAMLVLEAEKSHSGHHRSKMLVKLAKLLILAGEQIMSHADREIHSTFPGASLQKM